MIPLLGSFELGTVTHDTAMHAAWEYGPRPLAEFPHNAVIMGDSRWTPRLRPSTRLIHGEQTGYIEFPIVREAAVMFVHEIEWNDTLY